MGRVCPANFETTEGTAIHVIIDLAGLIGAIFARALQMSCPAIR